MHGGMCFLAFLAGNAFAFLGMKAFGFHRICPIDEHDHS